MYVWKSIRINATVNCFPKKSQLLKSPLRLLLMIFIPPSTVYFLPWTRQKGNNQWIKWTGKDHWVQNCAACLEVHAPPRVHITPFILTFPDCPSELKLPIKPPISLTFCICSLHLNFAPVQTPTYWKSHPLFCFVLLWKTHCHCTLEMLQLSTPPSLH